MSHLNSSSDAAYIGLISFLKQHISIFRLSGLYRFHFLMFKMVHYNAVTQLFENRNSTSENISTWCVLVVVRDLVRTKAYFVWRPSFAFSTYPTSWQALRSLALRGLHCLTFKPNGVKFSMKSQLKSLKTLFHTIFFQYLLDL